MCRHNSDVMFMYDSLLFLTCTRDLIFLQSESTNARACVASL